jgi:16S rRNA (guanine966-N2)-methyltransferase
MRIVGGALSGRKLASVGGGAPEAQLRPTSDRSRQALFNILEHGDYPPIEGARVLDLFAGTGALGIEALSRGAARVLFVEEHGAARALIRQNIETLDLIGSTRLFRRDATRLGPNRDAPYSLVFLDPPYGRGLAPKALASALEGGWIAEGATVVVETGAEEPFAAPTGFEEVDQRRYGAARLTLLRRLSAVT